MTAPVFAVLEDLLTSREVHLARGDRAEIGVEHRQLDANEEFAIEIGRIPVRPPSPALKTGVLAHPRAGCRREQRGRGSRRHWWRRRAFRRRENPPDRSAAEESRVPNRLRNTSAGRYWRARALRNRPAGRRASAGLPRLTNAEASKSMSR